MRDQDSLAVSFLNHVQFINQKIELSIWIFKLRKSELVQNVTRQGIDAYDFNFSIIDKVNSMAIVACLHKAFKLCIVHPRMPFQHRILDSFIPSLEVPLIVRVGIVIAVGSEC